MVQWVKNPALSLQWLGSLGNFHVPWVCPKEKKRAALDGRELPFMIGGLREAGVCMNGLSDI